jgi:sterol desaturase/sphingolipid hydroxylase (fatty acid hydroxylase superfamily)
MIHQLFDLRGAPLLTVVFIILFFAEYKFELRKRVQSKWARVFINSMVAIPSFVLLRFLFLPVMVWLAHTNESIHFGLNYLYTLVDWQEAIIAFLVLDYGNYLWHQLNHKVPYLWRYHLVHHSDPDLDITTAFRFHFGEMIGSVFSRGAVVFLSGVSPVSVLIYEIIFEAATQFHHTNVKLPLRLEKILCLFFVTPRLHGIHHSVNKQEAGSNFSVIFSFWDRLHKTFRTTTNEETIKTGVPSYSNQKDMTITFLLKLPYTKIREWDASISNKSSKNEKSNEEQIIDKSN